MNQLSTLVFLTITALLPIANARAACHFNTSNAIVCRTPKGAAYAFKKFGFDSKRTDLSFNRQLLQEANCGRAYNPNYKDATIKQTESGKIATPHGWVPVISAVINNQDIYYFAKPYVTGVCDSFVPDAPSIMDAEGHITQGEPIAPQ